METAVLDLETATNGEYGESFDLEFEPSIYFDKWLEDIDDFRNRERLEPSAGVMLNGHDLDFENVITSDDQLAANLTVPGTLIVAEHGIFNGNVEVSVAVIDGVFKGTLSASKSVIVENHAVIIGDINTPELIIHGGAIIEGKCSFHGPKEKEPPPVRTELKSSLFRVWRSRIFE